MIKIGGTLLDCAATRTRLAGEIGALSATGAQCVVVHGGGRQMTRFLDERGIESRFVEGLRVTTPEVLDAVLKVLAGSVNRELVATFIAAGVLAVGLTGMDALTTEAEPVGAELGFVGRPAGSHPALLQMLLDHAYLPVIACVAGDRRGQYYNVNADEMAVACAVALEADRLFFLTDVEGVRGSQGVTLPSLTPAQCAGLIQNGVASGGMRTKLEAAMDGLTRQVKEIVIAPGASAGIVQDLAAGRGLGTRLRA